MQTIYNVLKEQSLPINTNILPFLVEIEKKYFLWEEMKDRLAEVFYLECFSNLTNKEFNLALLEEMENIEREEYEELDKCVGLILAQL